MGDEAGKGGRESSGEESVPVVLHPSRREAAVYLLGCLLFVVVGGAMVAEGAAAVWKGWLCLGLFGLGAAVFATRLLPGANYLHLDGTGFTCRTMWRDRRVEWRDVARFGAGPVGVHTLPVWDYRDDAPQAATAEARRSKDLCGFHAALPDSFGRDPRELAALLEEWRRAALGVGDGPPPALTEG